MHDDIRPARGNHVIVSKRPSLAYDRPIPKTARPSLERRVDIVSARGVVSEPPVARSPAPQAQTYHAKTVVKEVVGVERAQHASSTKKWLKKMRRRSLTKRVKRGLKGPGLVYGAAVCIFLVGAVVTIQGFLLNTQVKEQSQVLAAKTGGDTVLTTASGNEVPSEETPKPNIIDTYTVAADLPRVLSIPSIGVRSRVLQVGVDANNQLLTPKSIYDSAWYNESAKPGEIGAAVIDGHYVGPTTSGVFSRLHELKKNDTILIERGDGKSLKFMVASVETVAVDKVDMMKVMTSADQSKAGLNIITCGGKYNDKTFEFADRTIVYAVLK